MNAQDDSAVGRFWAAAVGWGVDSEEPGVTNLEPVGFAYPDPAAVCIDVIAVPEPKTVKNRVHIDLATTSAAHQADLVLVVGSTNSSNSNRLVEVSRNLSTNAFLIEDSGAINPEWLQNATTVAVTAGASAPEVLVAEVVAYLRGRGFSDVEEVEVMPENVRFGLPPEIVQAIASAPAR